MIRRRGLLGGLLVALAAPAVIRTPGLLMPVKRVLLPPDDGIALLSASHPIDDPRALQAELEATFRAWQRARLMVTLASPQEGGMVMFDIAQEGNPVDAMALMEKMGQLEQRIALATGGAGLPFAAPADWDPTWWSGEVAQA